MSANSTKALDAQLRAALGLPSPKPTATPKRARRNKPAPVDGAALRLLSPAASKPAPAGADGLLTTAEVAERAERDRAMGQVRDPVDPDLVSLRVAAAEVGQSRSALTDAIHAGEIAVAGHGKLGAHLVRLSAVRAWLAERADVMAERGRYWRRTYHCIDGCGTEVRSHAGRCEECRRRSRVERMRERRARAREEYLQQGGDPAALRPGPKPGTPRSAPTPRTPKVVAPIVAPNLSPRPVKAAPPPTPTRTIARDAAVESGKSAWLAGRFSVGQGHLIPDPRGFWLVSGVAGLRPERVGADLADGERAIEQHWRDGMGNWQSRLIDQRGHMAPEEVAE